MLLICLLACAVLATAALGVAFARRGQRMRAGDEALTSLARAMSGDGTSRGHLLVAARQVAGAEAAFLAEPPARGDGLIVTATAGLALAGLHIAVHDEASAPARSYLADAPVEATDAGDELAARLRETAGLRTLHCHPVRRADRVVGVLVLGWTRRPPRLAAERTELVELLAGEAGRAIERDARVALLARQARTDELTALPNRRAWDEAVAREIARAQRTGEPLCLALLDLDHFKAFNDAHGHQAGDAHLRRTAAAWRRELRAIDVLARYGGEEFGVLLPSCTREQADEVIERVRAATPSGESASAGVVQYDLRESPDSLLARADAALYRAKHAGRGLTVVG